MLTHRSRMQGAGSRPDGCQPFRGWLGWVLPALLLASLAGCKVGGSAFAIDSNSRTPALGLSLVPRQSEPKIDDDAPGSSAPPRLASAEFEAPTPKKSARSESGDASNDASDDEDEDQPEKVPRSSGNKLTSWLRPGKSEKKRIALPRTDLADDEEWDDEDEE